MAVPVVLTTGARPVTAVESNGVPITPVTANGEPVTLVDSGGEPVVLVDVDGQPAFLLYSAKTYLGGITPYHYFDFVNNDALYAGSDVGTVSDPTGYSFSRASSGYYTNSDGTLTSFGSGVLRRGDRGVLIEGARTNLLTYSQAFDNAVWTDVNITATAAAAVAPDGTTTAYKFEATTSAATNSNHTAVVDATAATASVYVKKGSGATDANRFLLRNSTTATILVNATFNYDTGVITGTGASVETLANGWYRIILSASTGISSGNTLQLYLCFMGDAETAGEFAYVWGAQLEAGSHVSSYIPTTSASATRAGSSYLSATTSGLDSAVSMFAEVNFPVSAGAVQLIAQFDDGTNNNRIAIYRNAAGNAEMLCTAGGVSQGVVVGGAMANNTTHKIACSATANALRLSLNGTSATPDTTATMPTGLANIRVGAGLSIALPSFAYQPRFAMFDSALSASQLDTVTT